MSHIIFILILLLSTIGAYGMVCIADTNTTYYNGYGYDPEFVPSGMIPYEGGWSHGSLFSAPNWLLAHIDQSMTSTVLDYRVTPGPTESSQDFEDYISEGHSALEGGNYRAAYNAFKKATELEPTSPDAWYGFGVTLESQSRYLSALDAYAQAISHAKGASNWASYAGKGRILFKLNRFSESRYALETAIAHYEKAGVSHPDELEEINRLLEELNHLTETSNSWMYSAYIPATITGY